MKLLLFILCLALIFSSGSALRVINMPREKLIERFPHLRKYFEKANLTIGPQEIQSQQSPQAVYPQESVLENSEIADHAFFPHPPSPVPEQRRL